MDTDSSPHRRLASPIAGSNLAPARPARFLRPCSPLALAALLLFGFGAQAQALADWGDNPLVIPNSDDQPYVMIPLQGSAAVIQMGSFGIEIVRLDTSGALPPVSGLWWELGMDTSAPVVGCALGPRLFALGYSLDDETLRVVLLKRSGNNYVPEPGFPRSIGNGFHLKIVPNLPDPPTNGVMLAWLQRYSNEPNSPVSVWQQGVTRDGSLVWGGLNGVYVGETVLIQGVDGSHSIISDGQGAAITTFRSPLIQQRYWTTRLLDFGASFFDTEVPGPTGLGPCLVARDGLGGAFYFYAQDQAKLIATHITGNGQVMPEDPHVFSSSPTASPLLRPLAVVPTPGQSVVVAYRDLEAIRAKKFDYDLNETWFKFLSGATGDNSEEANGVRTPYGVAFAWTRTDSETTTQTVKSMLFNLQDGEPVWTPGEFNVYMGSDWPTRPQIIFSKGNPPKSVPGFIIGWCNVGVGLHADRLRSTNGMPGP